MEANQEAPGFEPRFRLTIPPDPSYVSTARLFASTLARHFGRTEEAVDDLKLAVSEACSDSLEEAARGPIDVIISVAGERLLTRIRGPEADTPGEYGSRELRTPRARQSKAEPAFERLALVRALFPDAEAAIAGGARVISFSA